MHDIRFIRENPDAFDAALKRRGVAPQAKKLLEMDADTRKSKTDLQALQSEMNALAKEIGNIKSKGGNADAQLARSKEIKEKLAVAKAQEEQGEEGLDNPLSQLLLSLPNILLDEVPEGADENANKEVRKHGEPKKFDFTPKDHVALGEALGLMDFEQAAVISGARFVVLKGALARLERALAQFMLDVNTNEFGYTEVSPPVMVKDKALVGTGNLPKFAEDLFRTENGYYLIPTAEVPVTNLVADKILDEAELPLRFTAHTPCFRSEAGSAGKDTRGMIRQHQFYKVELVSITTPEQCEAEHQRMTGVAEEMLKRLGLPYRVLMLCSGDTGFGSRKTYDLEVWLPGQEKYREISSCSQFGAFQARRMKARYRDKSGKPQFVNTLNGSALAVGRTLVAILENYQTSDGYVTIPDVLRPYMGGLDKIGPVKK